MTFSDALETVNDNLCIMLDIAKVRLKTNRRTAAKTQDFLILATSFLD